MRQGMDVRGRSWLGIVAASLLIVATVAAGVPATADTLSPPWNGEPVSRGLGPTYGEPWCADPAAEPGSSTRQGPPLAIIPYGAIKCTLEQFQAEAQAAGIPTRMSYEVIGRSVLGRDIYGVVVNALETPEQRRDYQRWLEIRSMMLTDPAGAQALLASYGGEVKIPIFIQASIHGNEFEGTDAMMQVIRDLVTTPYGTNEAVDAVLDHAIVVVIPTINPDGRVAGTRANANGFDMNRDLLVQSQPEMHASIAYQLRWLAPVALDMHGYYNPTLVDGLTKPHNPGIEYDKFLYWNQRRLDANEAALEAIGRPIQRPVNDWGPLGDFRPRRTGPSRPSPRRTPARPPRPTWPSTAWIAPPRRCATTPPAAAGSVRSGSRTSSSTPPPSSGSSIGSTSSTISSRCSAGAGRVSRGRTAATTRSCGIAGSPRTSTTGWWGTRRPS